MIKELIQNLIFFCLKPELATKKIYRLLRICSTFLSLIKKAVSVWLQNMIGVRKRIIVFDTEGTYMVMFNPDSIKNQNYTKQKKVA